eukprot:220686-Rhodomonas_salina.1
MDSSHLSAPGSSSHSIPRPHSSGSKAQTLRTQHISNGIAPPHISSSLVSPASSPAHARGFPTPPTSSLTPKSYQQV